ncbi:WD40 repeat-like protein [Infundibulicybe gibba]|nr:WD40 repeat-like protein [Infundibulicybe gibba]
MANTDRSNFLLAEAQLALDEARKLKSERIKDLGSPIQLSGKALAIYVRGGDAWIAENTAVARKVDLESGRTLQLYKGHTGPVTSLAFYQTTSGHNDVLITGSWDQTIKLWSTETKSMISSTEAHSDFVKALYVLPTLQLLISGGSDKVVRFWDLSDIQDGKPLGGLGAISSHTRPIACITGKPISDAAAILYTADTMGVIKVWHLSKQDGRWTHTMKEELNHHRTRVNEMLYENGQLWTASSDETVQALATHPSQVPGPVAHPVAVRSILPLSMTDLDEPYLISGAGDIIRVYDISSPDEPELISETDAHWHDVTAIRLWMRRTVGDDGKTRIEPWIISTSLDSTIRKWRLSDLLQPKPNVSVVEVQPPTPPSTASSKGFKLSEDEERELAELLDS